MRKRLVHLANWAACFSDKVLGIRLVLTRELFLLPYSTKRSAYNSVLWFIIYTLINRLIKDLSDMMMDIRNISRVYYRVE